MVRACPQKAYLHVCIPDTWYGMFLLLCFADKVEELAFAATGDFFLTRDPDCRTASLWSVKPDVALVQVWCSMQAAVCMYVCMYLCTHRQQQQHKKNQQRSWFLVRLGQQQDLLKNSKNNQPTITTTTAAPPFLLLISTMRATFWGVYRPSKTVYLRIPTSLLVYTHLINGWICLFSFCQHWKRAVKLDSRSNFLAGYKTHYCTSLTICSGAGNLDCEKYEGGLDYKTYKGSWTKNKWKGRFELKPRGAPISRT